MKKAYLFKHQRPVGNECMVVSFGEDVCEAEDKLIEERNAHRIDTIECIEEDIDVTGEREEKTTKDESSLHIDSISGSASDFWDDLLKLINGYCDKGLGKKELVTNMEYATESCRVS